METAPKKNFQPVFALGKPVEFVMLFKEGMKHPLLGIPPDLAPKLIAAGWRPVEAE